MMYKGNMADVIHILYTECAKIKKKIRRKRVNDVQRKHGGDDTTVNYMKQLMNQTLLITSKLKDWHGQGTWCI